MSNLQYRDLLTVRPQKTFFRADLKRHTDFDRDIQEIPFTGGAPNFNREGIAVIQKGGTLLSDLFLEVTLPPLANNGGSNGGIYTTDGTTYIPSSSASYLNWVNSIGFALIDFIELEINGNLVDKHTGLWLDVWNELSDKSRKEWDMVKKYDNRKNLKFVNYEKTTLRIPFKFFFCVSTSQALPITLLNSNAVRVTIRFNGLNKLVNCSDTLNSDETSGGSVSNVKLFGEFINLQQEEINTMTSSENKFTVPTLQYLDNVGSGSGSTFNVSSGSLTLTGAIKELIWVFRHNSRISSSNPQIVLSNDSIKGNDPFNYSNTHLHETFGNYEMFDTCLIKIRNTDIVEESAGFFGDQMRMSHGSGTKKNIYVYPFALYPEQVQPSGHFNFSINDDNISMRFSGVPGHTNTFYNNGSTNINSNASAADYTLSLFALGYKEIVISSGQANINNIPYSTSIN